MFCSEFLHRNIAFRDAKGQRKVSVGRLTSIEKHKTIGLSIGALERVRGVLQSAVQVRNINLLISIADSFGILAEVTWRAVPKIVKVPRPEIVGQGDG